MKYPRYRRRSGTSLAEVPVNLWVFVFILLLPFIDFVTLGYRATLAYFCVRDACHQAAYQPTFSTGLSTGNSRLSSDAAAWSGINFSNTHLQIVRLYALNNSETDGALDSAWSGASVPLTDGQTPVPNAYVYLLRLTTTAALDPIINLSAANTTWGNVPGLTGPINLNFSYQVTAENPNGLNQ
jgi:hypothetical protein